MSFADYNTNNVGTFLGTMNLMATTSEESTSLLTLDTQIKQVVATSLPPSPKKRPPRSRATTVWAAPPTAIAKTKVQFSLIDITNRQMIAASDPIKPLLKKAESPKPYAEEIPDWWSPDLPSLITTPEANIELNPKFDRALVYEYVREIRNTKLDYQTKLETFIPKKMKHLLTIIQDKQFTEQIKQFNSMINDSHIKCVEKSLMLARINIINQRFE